MPPTAIAFVFAFDGVVDLLDRKLFRALTGTLVGAMIGLVEAVLAVFEAWQETSCRHQFLSLFWVFFGQGRGLRKRQRCLPCSCPAT